MAYIDFFLNRLQYATSSSLVYCFLDTQGYTEKQQSNQPLEVAFKVPQARLRTNFEGRSVHELIQLS